MDPKKLNSYFRLVLLVMVGLYVSSCATIVYRSIPLKDIAKAGGKYPVGTQNYYLVDPTRSMWLSLIHI